MKNRNLELIENLNQVSGKIKSELNKVIVGQEKVIDEFLGELAGCCIPILDICPGILWIADTAVASRYALGYVELKIRGFFVFSPVKCTVENGVDDLAR